MLRKTANWITTVLIVLVVTIYFVRAFDSRGLPEPAPEHRIEFESEFDASQEADTDWWDYIAIERKLALELAEHIAATPRLPNRVDRYNAGSLTSPESFPNNWNRSYEISVPSPRGVAVLLHGLSDSPYSMRATAETLASAGYNVVVPRMPGHGFAVGGLRHVSSEDWAAAVRVAIRHAVSLPGSDGGLVLVGYSNGGLLAVDYGLTCGDVDELPCPKAIVLLSPAILVSPFAAAANLHSAVSWIPYFERFQWESILPEVDPFKYTSFPKQPGWEIHKMSKTTRRLLSKPGAADRLPPILAFQSVVDKTINASALVDILFSKLPDNGSELVAYDVNRSSQVVHMMKSAPDDVVAWFTDMAPLNYTAVVLGNHDGSSDELEAWRLAAQAESGVMSSLSMSWPGHIYSLSHIAIPFRPEDPLYGDGSVLDGGTGIVLGALSPRGERGMLRLSADYFMRARYNPFFAYQAERLTAWLEAL